VKFAEFWATSLVANVKLFVAAIKSAAGELAAFFQLAGAGLSAAGKFTGSSKLQEAGAAINNVGIGLERSVEGNANVPDKSDKSLRLTEMHQSNRVHIEVKGGNTNAETGKTVAGALGGVFANQHAHAADALGSGDDDEDDE
jgi:hypothetical protein